jgi:hypothetical protein
MEEDLEMKKFLLMAAMGAIPWIGTANFAQGG